MNYLYLFFLTLSLTACVGQGDGGGNSISPAPAAPAPTPAYQDLSPEEFAEKIGRPDALLIDVRTPGEIENGKIAGALELDFRAPDFPDRLAQLDTSKTYLIYCASGGRSSRAAEMAAGLGARRVYNLKGGYRAWR